MTTKEKIQQLRAQGQSYKQIALTVGVSKTTVIYHLSDAYKSARAKSRRALRASVKMKAVAYKGGACCGCGYSRCMGALEFHHLDSEEKEDDVTRMSHSFGWLKIKEELDKCVLVCCLCHREIHAGLKKAVDNSTVRDIVQV